MSTNSRPRRPPSPPHLEPKRMKLSDSKLNSNKKVQTADSMKETEGCVTNEEQSETPPTPTPNQTVGIKYIILGIAIVIGAFLVTDPEIVGPLHDFVISGSDNFPALRDWMRDFHRTPSEDMDKDESDDQVKTRSWSHDHNWMAGPMKDPRVKVMTDDDIKYVEGGKLFLVLVGHVFDVTSGHTYYKEGSGYHGFIGQDGSRAFITGEFNEAGLTNDLSGMDGQDYIGLSDWLKFYLHHTTYVFVGYHVGLFFDENGEETEEMGKFKEWVRLGMDESDKEADVQKLFPMCNVQWTAEEGSKVWCTTLSGGTTRDWVGFPRKFFETPDKPHRCACVHPNYLADTRVQKYEGCDDTHDACKLPKTDD